MTPIKAIRSNCLECSGDNKKEVKLCQITDCPLYPFRLGKNPNYKRRQLTEEQREANRNRLKKAREAKKTQDSTKKYSPKKKSDPEHL